METITIVITNAEADTLCINPCPRYPSGYGEPTWNDWRGDATPRLPERIQVMGFGPDDIANLNEMLYACQGLMPRGVRAKYISEKLQGNPDAPFPVALALYATAADREAARVASWAR